MSEIKIIGQMDNTQDHTFESANRVYSPEGIAPTIPTSCGGGHTPKFMEIQKVGNVVGKGESQGGNTYLTDGISPSLLAGMSHGNVMPFIVDEKPLTGGVSIVAMRGREEGQQLEPRPDECTNTITTVQKDNLVMVRQATKDGYIPCEVGGVADLSYPNSQTRRGRVIDQGKVCPTLTTENIPSVLEKWIWEIDGTKYLIRIRKLTPRECWRLMGFTDENFEKAQAVNSNTQLYKQAGNSIVKDVLMNVFKQLL